VKHAGDTNRTTDADPRLAPPLNEPRPYRIIAIETAQLLIERRRHELRRVARARAMCR
jgi:hypothetical protein